MTVQNRVLAASGAGVMMLLAAVAAARNEASKGESAAIMAIQATPAGLLAAPAGAPRPRARVAGGQLSGVREGAVNAFLGIPYAAPPVGAQRWRPPGAAPTWSGVRSADHFAASCWQPVTPAGFGPWTHEYVVSGTVSEDCLYLNVWTAVTRGAHLPVMVWIHGGGFASGSGSVPLYDGAALAARGIIVVTINYRLGVFGFFAHPELTQEARVGGTPPGNYGLQDMIAALRWVHANITAFGGDPDAITIAGQSAGAMSVHALIVSPLAKGLFRGAIAESGLLTTLPLPALADAERAGVALGTSLHAASLSALRSLPPEAFAGSGPAAPRSSPIADGDLLPATAAGTVLNDTPLLIGMNTDDPGSFGPPPVPSAQAVDKLLHDSYGALAGRFAPLYPAGTVAQQVVALRAIARDRGLAALYAYSRARLARSHQPLYVYLFDHVEPGPEAARYRAFHSAELAYVFDTLDAAPERGFTAQDRELARIISGYWLAFVRGESPASSRLPPWPRMRIEKPMIMHLGEPVEAQPLLPAPTLQAVRVFLAAGGVPRLF